MLNLAFNQTINLGPDLARVAVERQRAGADTPKLKWYVVEKDCGSITREGVYTAPSAPASRTCTIAARADGRAMTLARLTVSAPR
jgi:hypothetical protein